MRALLQAGLDPLDGFSFTSEPHDDRLYVFYDNQTGEYDLLFDYRMRSAILAYAAAPILKNYIKIAHQQLDAMEDFLVGGAAAILICHQEYDEDCYDGMRNVVEYTITEELIAQIRRLLEFSAKKHDINKIELQLS